MVATDHGGFGHLGVIGGHVLHVDGRNPLTAGLDHILGAIGNRHIAPGVDARHIAGLEPARLGMRLGVAVQRVVVGADPGAANFQRAEGLAIPGQFPARVVDDLHLYADNGPAALKPLYGKRLFAIFAARRRAFVDAAQRAHFRHTPAHAALYPVAIEVFHHRQRAGRAAHDDATQGVHRVARGFQISEQPQPHRGHARRQAHAFLVDQGAERCAVAHLVAREDQLGARHGAGVGRAPGIHMEHGHDRQHRIAPRDAHGIGHQRRVGVQHGGAVGVQHPLGMARGAGGIAQRAGLALIQGRPVEVIGVGLKQMLVARDSVQRRVGHVLPGGQHDPLAHRGALRRNRLDQGHKVRIDKHHLILGVVDDVHDLFGEQARVDRMADAAAARCGVIGLEVPIVVPGQGGDPGAARQIPGRHGIGQAARAPEGIAIGVAMARVIAGYRDNLAIAVHLLCVAHDRGDSQRDIHHQTVHGNSLKL